VSRQLAHGSMDRSLGAVCLRGVALRVMDRKGRGPNVVQVDQISTSAGLSSSWSAVSSRTRIDGVEPNDGPPWAGVRVAERLPAYRDWNASRTCRLPLGCDPMTMKHEDLDRAHPPSHDRLRSGEVGWGRRRARRTHRA
jgi:hypothetical protein